MSTLIAFVSVVFPIVVSSFAFRKLGLGVLGAALTGLGFTLLIGAAMEIGAYASSAAMAVVCLSSMFSLVLNAVTSTGIAGLHNENNRVFFMTAGHECGAISEDSKGMIRVSRPVMIFSSPCNNPTGFASAC